MTAKQDNALVNGQAFVENSRANMDFVSRIGCANGRLDSSLSVFKVLGNIYNLIAFKIP
jgi:hypothetical protein